MLSDATLTAALYRSTGVPITYQPAAGGAALSLRACPLWEPSAFGELVDIARQDAPTYRVQIADLAAPAAGDTLTDGANTYTVDSWERLTQSEWRLHVRAL